MFIIATIGHTSLTKDKIKKIVLAGADVLRYNFSYRIMMENLNFVRMGKEIIDELHAPTKILIDFPLNKVRLGDFDIKVFAVRENEELIFKSAPYTPDCNQFIPVEVPHLGEKTHPNQTITIGDGEVSIQVLETIDADTIKARILNNGVINYMKTFNIEPEINEAEILKSYENVFKKISALRPDYIAISYINEKITEQIKKADIFKKSTAKIIVKIENSVPDAELNRLCRDNFPNFLLIDRGEIGVNMPYEKLGVYQKQIMALASEADKPVIVSTQILDSIINNYTPSRSDILDLTNSVLDGVEGIMLCLETSGSARPAYAIATAKKIIAEAEKYKKEMVYDRHDK